MISQLTLFLENEKGRLAAATRALADGNINMLALNLADTSDFGVLRILCDKPEQAASLLKEQGWRVSLTPVFGLRIPNKPGGLADLLQFIDDHDPSVEYAYCFSVDEDNAIDVLKLSTADPASLERDLKEAGFSLV